MNIIFSINGGIGKSVMATAVCRAIKKQYPESKLIVQTGYPDVFSNNPIVDMVFAHGQETYFYNKYIENKDIKVFANEPYLVTEHILYKEHVIETFCKMNGVNYNGELPEIYVNEREANFYRNKYPSERPIMVLQTNGGGQTDIKYSWARDMPRNVILSVIEEFRSKYDIFHIRREDQFGYEHTIPIHDNFKAIASLILRSEKRVLIDSFCQHTAAALKKPSTVLWICNRPNVFGYSIHDNIKANPENGTPDLKYSVLQKYNIAGAPNEFPYFSENDIFNVDQIISSVVNQR
jgi:hypothetical protein